MKASHSFHLYFERDANKPNDIKKGGLSLSFGSEEAAKDAYVNARDKLINGTKIKLQGHKWFEQQYAVSLACDSSPTGSNLEIAKDADIDLVIPKDPNTHAPFVETVSRKESLELDEVDADIDVDRKLFVSQLLPTTDQDLIFAVFGQENLQNVQINDDNRKSDGTKSAILTFCSPELAEQSKQDYDGFVIDDGDMSKPMKITLYSEYLNSEGSFRRKVRIYVHNMLMRWPVVFDG
uniref:RRM domain-containing protein n=1 Tax=Romanomermis culicivorax TaxID=13658 RepID=A0A915L0V8_ROMCU